MKQRPPVTAKVRFEERRREFEGLDLSSRFTKIRETNLWGAEESVSGLGSELAATARLRDELPKLLASLGAKSLLDIPCGDFRWMNHVNLAGIRYVGGDIVEALVEENRAKYAREFVRLNLCTDALPQADVVFCRDCLVHLSFANIGRAVANLKRSGSMWLLTTHFLECAQNVDIEDGDWRMLNFELPPFHWGAPERVLVEGCTESGGGYEDKALGLWRVGGLRQL
ncbi:MAG: class I SAM-dependent methyltransferase [Candidatus Solibacter usitatus]|nr:class I SAM-dependent methyltransferase [Candidatus Solibacter usitatus]